MLRARFAPFLVFTGTFLLLLALYWPTRNAGWVSDTLGWLDAVRTQSFADFVNRSDFGVRSLYQTTQTATWIGYRLFGANRLAWHLLHITLQALNAALLFAFFRQLLGDSKLPNVTATSLLAVVLFILSPYLSEVLVWEAAFHYLQGLLFILIQLLLLQAFLRNGRSFYGIVCGIVFCIASFSLELFYLTPAFSFLLLLHCRFGTPQTSLKRIRLASRSFLLPQLIILALHLGLIRILYGTHTGRLGDGLWNQPLSYFAIKPPDYLLHLFGGRFLPQNIRSAWHQFFCTYAGAGLFYAAFGASLSFIFFRYRRMSSRGQLISWAWCTTLTAMALVTPMWFPERLLIMGDRYLYLMLPFFLLIVSLLIGSTGFRFLKVGAASVLIAVSVAATMKLSRLWERSELLTQKMQERFPVFPEGTRVILLNNPANFGGAPMAGASAGGEFALMRRLLYQPDDKVIISEAFAAEYTSERQDIQVTDVAAGTKQIALVDTARRWWFGPDYARAFTGEARSVKLISPTEYELTLPANHMPLLVFWTGNGFENLPTGAGNTPR